MYAVGLALSCYFWKPKISMQRAQTSLLEDERQYEAETTHLPTIPVSEAILEHPAPTELPVTGETSQAGLEPKERMDNP